MQGPSHLGRKDLIAIIAAAIAALIVRSIALSGESLWIDEVMTALRSDMAFGEMMRSIAERDHLPLYYTVMWGWVKLFGTSEIGIRSFSVLVGVLSIVPIYLIGRRTSFRSGVMIGAVACFLPVQIYFAQEAKMYSLIILLSSVSVFALMEYLRPVLIPLKKVSAGLLLVANILLAYTHYYAYLLILAELIFIIYLSIREDEKWNWKVIAGRSMPAVIPMASGILWAAYLASEGILFDQTTGGGISLTPGALLSIFPFLTGSYVVPDSILYVPILMASLFLMAAVVIGSAMKHDEESDGRNSRSAAVIFLFLVPIIALLISLTVMNIYGQRYFLILSPVIFYLAVVPIKIENVRKVRNVLLILVLVSSIIALPVQYTQAEKNDWRGAVSYIQENGLELDIVIPVPFWERLSISYYGPDLEIVYGKDENDLDEKMGNSTRIWLIVKELRDDGWTKDHLENRVGAPVLKENYEGLSLYLFER